MNISARGAATAIVVLAAVAAVAGQAPSRGQPRPPTFRAEVRYVEIDADVTDPQGRFVRGLTRNDFQLFEDGVRQDLVSFRLVDLPIEAPLPPLDSARAPLEPDVTTNTGEGRMYVFLLDKPNGASNIGNDALNARNWARQFIDGSLRPNDIAAVVHVQGNVSDGQPFTSNRRLLEASVERLTFAGSAVAGETPDERIQAIRHSFQAIQDISERLGAVTGRRKAILWINGSVPFDPSEISGDAARQGSVAFMQRDAVRAATRNNVALYAIDPAGLTTSQGLGELQRAGALRALAEETGGEAIVGTNNPRPGIERIVARSSTYYLLGYYPSMDHRDGKFHNVSVRVSRPGLSVRAKKGYYATAGGSAVSGAPRSLADGLSAGGREALRSPAPVRGLDVQLFAAAFRGTKNAASVLVSAQFGGRALRLGANDQVEVSYQPIDRQGKLGKGFRKVFTLNLKPDSRTIAEQSGLRFVDRLELPPGRHELRLAASQPTGSTGSVVAQIEVPDFTKEPLMLSGVVIASRNAGVPQQLLLSEPRVSKTLRVDPTAVRRFTRDDELTAFAEAYVNGSGSPENVEVSYTITSESGAVLVTAPGRTVDDGAPADPRRAAYSGRLPLTVLAPGNYVLLARATARGNSVTRQVPITVVSR